MGGRVSGVVEMSGADNRNDFLLELRSEEIPARMQTGARAELEKLFRREMTAAGVSVGEVTVWSSPPPPCFDCARPSRYDRGGKRGGEGPTRGRTRCRC